MGFWPIRARAGSYLYLKKKIKNKKCHWDIDVSIICSQRLKIFWFSQGLFSQLSKLLVHVQVKLQRWLCHWHFAAIVESFLSVDIYCRISFGWTGNWKRRRWSIDFTIRSDDYDTWKSKNWTKANAWNRKYCASESLKQLESFFRHKLNRSNYALLA